MNSYNLYLQRGSTALYLACNRQHTGIALMLLHAGCEMDHIVEVCTSIITKKINLNLPPPLPSSVTKFVVIPRQSRRDIVLTSSVRPSIYTFCPSETISQYLLVRFDSFLVQMISCMDSPYPISLVKIDPSTAVVLV